MIEIRNLTKQFGDKVAVDNLSFTIPDGKVYGFLGPNGAGKTTTIRCICGLDTNYTGDIIINGHNGRSEAQSVKKCIAYVPDEPKFYEFLSGNQYLNFIADVFGISTKNRENLIMRYCDVFDFKDQLSMPISSYSHGMKQKLSLIAAFIHSPSVIILDEPLVGLDAKTAKVLKTALRQYANDGNTVFYSTHVMDVAERFCDEFEIINKGKSVFNGSFEALKAEVGVSDSTLEDIFLELTEI